MVFNKLFDLPVRLKNQPLSLFIYRYFRFILLYIFSGLLITKKTIIKISYETYQCKPFKPIRWARTTLSPQII